MRWTVLGGLELIADKSRWWIRRNGDSLEATTGMNVMLEIEGWARRFVRSKE